MEDSDLKAKQEMVKAKSEKAVMSVSQSPPPRMTDVH